MNYRHFTLLAYLFLCSQFVSGQCPGALKCEDSEIFFLIDSLDGFTCSNPDFTNDTFPRPTLCFGAGVVHNVNWWGFIGNGTPLALTFNFDPSSCRDDQGIQAGVFEGSCDGTVIWDCNASCNTSSFELNGITLPGHTYYVWVDGCNEDVCSYTMSVNGGGGEPPLLPDNMPGLQVLGSACAGTSVEVRFPGYHTNVVPVLVWSVDGEVIRTGADSIIDISIPCSDTSDQIEVCLKAVIGNPNLPSSIIDQDSTCKTINLLPAEVHIGSCQVLCFEDLPYSWHGMAITSSCINPPCTVRASPGGDACCVDSVKSFITLPAPGVGSRDTFICDPSTPYVTETGNALTGELCDGLISFTRPVTSPLCPGYSLQCDTSYYLSVARLTYTKDLTMNCFACSGETIICPNIQFETDCPKFEDQVDITLVWLDPSTGDTLDVTGPDGCLTVTKAGQYYVYIEGTYDGIMCSLLEPEIITVPDTLFGNRPVLTGDNYLCQESVGYYTVETDFSICEYNWTVVDDQGDILTPSSADSSRIRIDWSNRTSDQAEVCVEVLRDCGRRDTCWSVYFDSTETLAIDTLVLCQEDTIQLQEPVTLSDRTWSTGETTSSIEVVGPGTYCVNGTPVDGSCEIAKCFVVVGKDLDISDTTITNDSGQGNGSITVVIETDDTIDKIEWSNGDTTLAISGLEAGIYTLTLMTESGCTYTFEFEVMLSTATKVVNSLEAYFIAPNPGPTLHLLPLDRYKDIQQIEVFDVKGKLVAGHNDPGSITGLQRLSDGVYLVRVRTQNGDVQVLKWTKVE